MQEKPKDDKPKRRGSALSRLQSGKHFDDKTVKKAEAARAEALAPKPEVIKREEEVEEDAEVRAEEG